MSAQSAVLAGRQASEQLMVDTCVITRGGTRTFNPGDGTYTVGGGTTVYEGKCRVQIPSLLASPGEEQAGQREWTANFYMLMLPVSGTETVAIDDLVTIVTSANDTALQGKPLYVTGLHAKTHATSRRLRCEEYLP